MLGVIVEEKGGLYIVTEYMAKVGGAFDVLPVLFLFFLNVSFVLFLKAVPYLVKAKSGKMQGDEWV